jgi:MFS family permease
MKWLLQLDQTERSTLIATFAGWMLDGLDVMVYSFVLPTLILIWHISKGQAGLLGTSALVVSSIGGWLAGLAADRYGRVRILQITIVWFAVFTFLSGFTHSFTQLLITRGLQGLGFGGEWAVGSVLIGENIRPALRGRAVGTTQSGWAIGWAIAAICYTGLFKFLPAAQAWRWMFFIGILPALLALWIRHHVNEPELFLQTRRRSPAPQSLNPLVPKSLSPLVPQSLSPLVPKSLSPSVPKSLSPSVPKSLSPLKNIFSPAILRTTALASLVALGAQGGYHAVNTFLPLYLNQRGLGIIGTGAYLIVIIAGSFAGYLTSAHLADSIGRRAALALFAAGSILAIGAYTLLPLGNRATLIFGFPLGFFTSGAFGPMGSFFTELFPTAIRASGQGFAYNFGRGLGAFFPALVGLFSARMPLGSAIALFALTAYLLMVIGVLLLPETRARDISRIGSQHAAEIDAPANP